MGDATDTHVQAMPQPHLTVIQDGVWQLLPLSRKGSGPGLILLTPDSASQEETLAIKDGIPSPLVKWAEESYTVVQIHSSVFNANTVQLAIQTLASSPTIENKGRYGLIVYDATTFQTHEPSISSIPDLAGAVIYTSATTGAVTTKLPSIQHLSGPSKDKPTRTAHLTTHVYPNTTSPTFPLPTTTSPNPHFNYAQEAVSHTRNLTFLKHHTILSGPIFDLEALWDEHTYYEFGTRDVAATMSTMVAEPYVNHIPTLTGGIGRANLTDFYTHHFVFANPDDAELELISRTVGVDRVVDEFIYKFTHDRAVDWLAPGIPPTGNKCEVPMMAVVNIRGDRLYHEHIHWDGATVLRQLGVLPTTLPWPSGYDKPGPEFIDPASADGPGKVLEARIPAAGVEAASKLRDKNAVKSNFMFDYKMSYKS